MVRIALLPIYACEVLNEPFRSGVVLRSIFKVGVDRRFPYDDSFIVYFIGAEPFELRMLNPVEVV